MNKLFIASAVVAGFSAFLMSASTAHAQNVAATVSASGANVDIGTGLVGFDNITVGAAINLIGDGSAFSTSTIAATSSSQALEIGALGVDYEASHSSEATTSTAAANADPLTSLNVTVGSSASSIIVDLAPPISIGVGVAEEEITVDAQY